MRLRLRLRTRLHRGALERDLAEIPAAARSPEHALRAAQLTGARERAHVAGALRRVVRDAGRPAPHLSAAIPVNARAVTAAGQSLLGIAELLDGEQPVGAAGIARLRRLLSDGGGPLYRECADRMLNDYLWWVADGLRRQDDLAVDMAGLHLGVRVADL